MSVVLRVVGDAYGTDTPHAGRLIAWYNPDTPYGTLELVTTSDPKEAKVFAEEVEALEYWRQISAVEPLRPDGKPNRPLTALTVNILSLERAQEAHLWQLSRSKSR
jgi:hypothetical protein